MSLMFLADALPEEFPSAFPLSEVPNMPSGDFGAAFAKMFITLIALVALLVLTYFFLRKIIQRRLQKGVGNHAIQLVEKRMISAKTMLYLVEVEGKKILLAESHLEIKRLEGWELEVSGPKNLR